MENCIINEGGFSHLSSSFFNSNCDQSKMTKLYCENELDLGWTLVIVSKFSFYDPDSAKVHYNNAYKVFKGSDALSILFFRFIYEVNRKVFVKGRFYVHKKGIAIQYFSYL